MQSDFYFPAKGVQLFPPGVNFKSRSDTATKNAV